MKNKHKKFIKNHEDNLEMKQEYDFSNGIRGKFYRAKKMLKSKKDIE